MGIDSYHHSFSCLTSQSNMSVNQINTILHGNTTHIFKGEGVEDKVPKIDTAFPSGIHNAAIQICQERPEVSKTTGVKEFYACFR